MSSRDRGIRLLRAAALAGAALLLPCCRDQVGEGDQLDLVTVRASLTTTGVQPNLGCFEPSFSPNGRWVVFASSSNTLTPNDNNGIRDIFLKDRQTGQIVNLTNVLVFGTFPQYAPADCFEPAVSDDGNFIVFSSLGGWVPYTAPASPNPFRYIYRYDRANDLFERAYDAAVQPNGAMSQPSISADGNLVCFATTASNLTPANGSGAQQIYVHDMTTGVSRIVSRAQSPAALNVPCNAACRNPRMSPDGGFIAFESNATNLNAATAAAIMPQAYLGTSAGAYATVLGRDSSNVLTDNATYLPSVSEGGRYVVFGSYDAQIVNPAALTTPILVRRDLLTGTTELVTSTPGLLTAAVFPNGYPTSISADGRLVAFLGRSNALTGTTLNFIANVFLRDMQGGVRLVSRHLDGTPSNIDCEPPRISTDGKWVLWATPGSTMVDEDSNGVSDVFLRGPY